MIAFGDRWAKACRNSIYNKKLRQGTRQHKYVYFACDTYHVHQNFFCQDMYSSKYKVKKVNTYILINYIKQKKFEFNPIIIE